MNFQCEFCGGYFEDDEDYLHLARYPEYPKITELDFYESMSIEIYIAHKDCVDPDGYSEKVIGTYGDAKLVQVFLPEEG